MAYPSSQGVQIHSDISALRAGKTGSRRGAGAGAAVSRPGSR